MDPLSATLAVLALATALKDIIEVANNIQDAFSKLPSNYRNAQKLIRDVVDTLEQMQATYREDMEHLDRDGALKKSFNNLKSQMLNVYTECAILIPPVTLKRRDKFKIAVYTFWNRDKVEELISDLKERVDKSLRLFSILSTMRTELTVNKIDDTLNNALQALTPSSKVVRHNFDAHSMGTISDAHLFSFNQSSTTPMTWMPDTIPPDVLSKAYLRRELGNLDRVLHHLSTHWFEDPSAHLDIPQAKVSWFLQVPPSSSSAMQADAVMLTLQVRNLMESPTPLWVHNADIKLSHLATALGDLFMHDEAVSVNKLRIEIWTALATVYPDSAARDRLVTVLTSLAVNLHNMGDQEQSQQVSDHAMSIIESMPERAGGADIQSLIARNFGLDSGHQPRLDVALDRAEAAVQQIETVLGLPEIVSQITLQGDESEESAFVGVVSQVSSNNATHDHLFTYAAMLAQLSQVQVTNDLLREASKTGKQRLAVLHRLAQIYPGSSRVLHSLSSALLFLSVGSNLKVAELNTDAENVQYAEENTEILTQLTEIDPQRYVLSLMSSLYTKRHNFISVGRVKDARKVHEQMLGLGTKAADPYSGLKLPSETEGDYYIKLAEYHYSCERFQDAIYAARNCASVYAALEELSPGQSPFKHFLALVFLCRNLYTTQQYDVCIAEGFKALHILDNSSLKGNENDLVDVHMELLDKLMEALEATSDSRALTWARDVNSRIQKLFLSSGRKIQLQNAQAPNKYVSILQKNDLIEEAAQYLEDAFSRWEDTYGTSANRDMMGISHLQCLMALPEIFKAKGDTETALKYSQQAMDVAEEFFRGGFHIMKAVIYNNLASTHIYLLNDSGRYSEALALSELAVGYARENTETNDDGSSGLIQALGVRTFCQLFSLLPHDAIVSATEGISLSRTSISTGHGKVSLSTRLTMLYISLLNLADGLGDTGDIDQALLHLAEAKETLIKQEIAAGDEVGTDAHSYQVVAIKQARLLFAKGSHTESAGIIEKVINKDRERAKARKSVIAALIKELQFAGILFCTLGRHADGILAAAEVADLKRSLSSSPGLRKLVEVGEKSTTSRGLWKSVQNAKDKLTCKHQDLIFRPA